MTDRAPPTILVVDDEEVKRYTVARILSRAGFAVQEATSGAEALRLVGMKPDLIVLDVQLPDIDGREVCRRLKADPETSSIPILHLSATYVESDDRILGLESGADGYLTDVVEPQELLATVRALLRAREAEEEARRAALQWQATFEAIGDGVCLLGRSGEIIRCNRAAIEILDRPASELIGRPIVSSLPQPPCEAGDNSTIRALESGRRVSCDVALGARLLHVDVDPIRDASGAFDGSVCIISDVTERRRSERALRESEEHFRMLVDGVKDYAILMTDVDGLVVSWNPGAERILGYDEAEIVGRPIDLIFTPEDIRDAVPERERDEAARNGRAEDERWHRRQNGSRFWASGVNAPLRDESGGLRGFAKVMRDETERKRLEEELLRRAEDLQTADRQKDEFLAMLAHELRNPLAPIRNALEVIRLDPDPSSVTAASQIASRQVAHMARLLDDLLDVSRITSGKIELKTVPVDLARLVGHAADAARPIIDAGHHRLTVSLPDQPVRLIGDPTRLEQVFSNLLTNAAKYTESGGSITIRAERRGDEAVVTVVDNGIGLTAEMLPHVFDLFAQADRSLARAQGGLGIGLTLVRTLVHLHGGSVTAQSDGPGLGSTFTVRLPIPKSVPLQDAPGHNDGDRSNRTASLAILVVDDSVDSARSLGRVLTLWGHRARMVFDGPAAIESVDAQPTDLVLLDIGLPGMDGFQVASRLAARPDPPTLVALTGYGQQDDRQRARDAGFDHHLIKPVDLDELQALLARVRPS